MLGLDYLKKAITIQSVNPYVARYPDAKVIPRTGLDVMKQLRAEGHRVVVLPDDDRPVEYLIHKGPWDVLSDPLIIFAAEKAIDLIIGMLGAYLYDKFRSGRSSDPERSNSAIVISGKTDERQYDHRGDELTGGRWHEIQEALEDLKAQYTQIHTSGPPNPAFPWPVFLEHTTQLVGWTALQEDDYGLRGDFRIFDPETRERIERGELVGGSITGIVAKSTCSICSGNYADCNHLVGVEYEGKSCVNGIDEVRLCSAHVVSKPVNPKARLNIDLSLGDD